MKIVAFSGSKFAQFLTRTGLVLAISALPARAGSPPANDNFADRTALTGQSALVSTYNNNATVETGDPSLGNRTLTRTLWWSWTAPYTGWANFSTFGSDGPLVVGVFVGDSLPELSSVGVSNGEPWYLRYGNFPPSYQPFTGDSVNGPVETGKTYQIVVAAPAFSSASIGRVVLGINQSPTILSGSVVTGTTGSGLSYRISASNWPTTYDAQGLPNGLTVDPYSGIISGTPSSAGLFDAVVSATNAGGTGQATIRFEIAQANASSTPPVFTSGNAVNKEVVGASFNMSILVSGATQVTADSLPPGIGLRFNSGSCSFFGSPSEAGTFVVPLHAANSAGTTDTQIVFQIREKPPLPAFSSSTVAYETTGTSFYYYLSASDMANGTYAVGPLPAGLRFSGTSISGTLTEAGTFEIPVTATNTAGSTSATLTIVAADAPTPTPTPTPTTAPVFTNSAGVSSVGLPPFNYNVSSNDPTARYTASGLPSGLSIDPTTGWISGVPTTSGTYTANVTATNAIGSTTSQLTLALQTLSPFLLISPAMAAGNVGTSFSYSFRLLSYLSGPTPPPSQAPTLSIDPTSLPTGLTYKASTSTPSNYNSPFIAGTITGTPTTAGIYRVPVTVIYLGASVNSILMITVAGTPPQVQLPVITSQAAAAGNVGLSFYYYINASNAPVSYTASNLPPGLTFNSSSGVIQGKPTQSGNYVVDLAATNSAGTSHAKVAISITPLPLATINAPASLGWFVGYNFNGSGFGNYISPFTGSETFTATGLPQGVTLSASGSLGGSPTKAGNYPITLSVTNGAGTTTASLSIVATDLLPSLALTSPLFATGNVGDTFSYSATTSDIFGGSFQVDNLPPGLTASNGFISGKPTKAGTFKVNISVVDGNETASGILTLQINPPAAPTLTLPASTLAYLNEGFNYTFDGSDATSYSISGQLPKGVYLNSLGELEGPPRETGSFPLQITATGPGGSITVPFTICVEARPLPIISAPLVISQDSSYGFTEIDASNAPTSFSAQRIPANLQFANYGTYADISGYLTGTGSYPALITAVNSAGSSSAIVTFTSNSALGWGFSAAMVSATANEAFYYTPYSGSDPFMKGSTYSAVGLPSGLTIDPSSGKITGTPTAPGTYPVNITAIYGSSVYTQFTLTIVVAALPELPLITSDNIINATCEQSLGIGLYHKGEVTSYSLDPVPPGLKFDTSSGYLSGTPTVAGTYNVTATVTNAAGTRSANLLIQIAPNLPAPILDDQINLLGYTGEKFDHSIQAYNSPTSYSATGLPPGLKIDTSSGDISGTPTIPGQYPVTISATNAAGTTTGVLSMDVLEARAPVISSSGYATGTVGGYFNYSLGASHSPISFTASNLPPGLGLDPSRGTISGYPIIAGDYVVPVTASNAALTGTANITIHVTKEAAGILESAAQVTGTVGVPASISLYSTVSDSTYSADGLPPGLSLAPGKSTITGTPTTAGHYEVSVHVVTDGTETKSTLSIDIAGSPMAPPVIGAALSGFVGAGYIYPLYISNSPTRITAEGLPDGVILDPSTGVLTGTPKMSGLYAVTITATNASGSSTAVLNVTTIAPLVPVATTNANLYTALTGSTSIPISVSSDSYPLYPAHGYNPYYPLRVPYSPYLQPSVLAAVISVAGLPPGLIFNSTTAEIEGRSTKAGDFPLTITATTPLATTTTYTMLHVTDTSPAASGALRISLAVYLNAFGAVGSPFQLNLTPVGLATDVTCTGLPDGLNLQKTAITSNGTPSIMAAITGSPVKAGTYPVKFTFSNSTQTASGTVTIVVPDSPEVPSFSGSLAASGVVGRSFSYYIGDGSGYATSSSVSLNNAASTGDGISKIDVSGLPPGLQFNSLSNSITGTPSTAGSYVVPISLTNAGGTTSANVLITIADQQLAVPQLLGSGTSLGASTVSFAGEPIHLSLDAANSTTNVTASGLPDGVTLGKASGGSWTLSGTPATAGIYNFFLTATSDQGTETVPLTLNVRQLDQSVPEPLPDATPAPTPATVPPTVVVNQQHVDTTDDQVAIRGRVLAYQPGCTVTVKAGAQSWQRLRVSPDGSFKLNLTNLPVGITHVTIRTRDSAGNVRTTRIQVRRHIA